jgi:acyl dehydratase
MPLNLDAVGRDEGPAEVTWTSTDALLYALGVGAGQEDPLRELAFTTENTAGVTQQVVPSFGVIVVQRARLRLPLGEFDLASLVHAEQGLTLAGPLPAEGRALVTSRLAGIDDKGSGALAVTESEATDPATGETLLTTRSSAFIRGEGGFGGERGPSSEWRQPEGRPDAVVSVATRPDQALLYRLCGDRNPLHSDPAFAARGGFERPILHGLCTYGITARVLVHAACEGDPTRFRSMAARFSKPVLPGERLTVSIWQEGAAYKFRTTDSAGAAVIDHGTLTVA